MALIKCSDCQNDVSDKAPACPKCGCPIPAPAVSAPVPVAAPPAVQVAVTPVPAPKQSVIGTHTVKNCNVTRLPSKNLGPRTLEISDAGITAKFWLTREALPPPASITAIQHSAGIMTENWELHSTAGDAVRLRMGKAGPEIDKLRRALQAIASANGFSIQDVPAPSLADSVQAHLAKGRAFGIFMAWAFFGPLLVALMGKLGGWGAAISALLFVSASVALVRGRAPSPLGYFAKRPRAAGLAFFCFLGFAMGIGTYQKSKEAMQKLDKARAAYEESKWAEAAVLFAPYFASGEIKEEDKNAYYTALLSLGVIEFSEGKYSRAQANLEQALRVGGDRTHDVNGTNITTQDLARNAQAVNLAGQGDAAFREDRVEDAATSYSAAIQALDALTVRMIPASATAQLETARERLAGLRVKAAQKSLSGGRALFQRGEYQAAINQLNSAATWFSEAGDTASAVVAQDMAAKALAKYQAQEQARLQQEAKDRIAARQAEEDRKFGAENETMAYVMCQDFVRKKLKAPKTAEFIRDDRQIAYLGKKVFLVSGYVDAQNSFGAQLRNQYACKLRSDGKDMWYLLDLGID